MSQHSTTADISVRPTSLTVVAYCEQNKNTYQVGPTAGTSNTIPGNQSSIVWNPYEWSTRPGQPPFAMASYTLKIWDERGENSKQVGGYLAPYSKTVFGMYLPRAYTPLSGTLCTTIAFTDARMEMRNLLRRNDCHLPTSWIECPHLAPHHPNYGVRTPPPPLDTTTDNVTTSSMLLYALCRWRTRNIPTCPSVKPEGPCPRVA